MDNHVVIVGYIQGLTEAIANDPVRFAALLAEAHIKVITLAGDRILIPSDTPKTFIPLASDLNFSSGSVALGGPYRFFLERKSDVFLQIPVKLLNPSGAPVGTTSLFGKHGIVAGEQPSGPKSPSTDGGTPI